MPGQRRSAHTRGFTLVEALLVLAVLGVLAGLGVVTARPALEMRAARAVRALLLHARVEAMWTGAPVAVVELPGGAGLAARASGAVPVCDSGGRTLATVRLRDFPGVTLARGLRSGGLYWLPSGSGRDCDGGGVISGTLELRGPFGSAAVVVSSLGRVRVEAGP